MTRAASRDRYDNDTRRVCHFLMTRQSITATVSRESPVNQTRNVITFIKLKRALVEITKCAGKRVIEIIMTLIRIIWLVAVERLVKLVKQQ